MDVVFYNRDFSGRLPLPKGLNVEVERYSWNMIGGPNRATLRTSKTADRFELKKLLRCPVEIYGVEGKIVWWGFVNRVNIPNGDVQRVGIGLDELYNYVIVAYADGDTAAASDTTSITEYGQKETRLSDFNATQTEGEQTRDLYLADRQEPHMEFEFSGGSDKISIECYGWYSSLGWKYYTDTGTTNTENTTQISDIVDDAGQFLNGAIIEDTASITSNPYRDGKTTALTNINQLLNAGTSNTRPLLAYVDKSRYLHVYERSAEPSNDNVDVVMREDNKLETPLGRIIPPEECTVAKWGRLKGADNFPPFFIENAEYNADSNETTYRPASAFEQIRLAKFISSVVSGNNDGSSAGSFYPYIPFENHVHTRPTLHRIGSYTLDVATGTTQNITIASNPSSLHNCTYAGLTYFSPGTDDQSAPGWEVTLACVATVELNVEVDDGTTPATTGDMSVTIYKRGGIGPSTYIMGYESVAVPAGGWSGAQKMSIYIKRKWAVGDFIRVTLGNNTDGDAKVNLAEMVATIERFTG